MLRFLEWSSAHADSLLREAGVIWRGGGGAMIAIAAIALVMFTVGTSIWVRLSAKGHRRVPEREWRRWLDHPAECEGPMGELVARIAQAKALPELANTFEELRAEEIEPFQRDLKLMKVCVSAAPLVGLLGTVIGMLSTFGAMASGSGGDDTMAKIAKGISEALITTETGLVVALPGLFFQSVLARRYDGYRAFLAHMETAANQTLYRRRSADVLAAARRVARAQIAERLKQGTLPGCATGDSDSDPDSDSESTSRSPRATAALS